jgi:large subunit ribosomal protein L23
MSREKLLKVLLAPHVSEKTTVLADGANQFVFKVTKDATKQDVKEAVEMLFEVKVDKVRVLNAKAKAKRRLASGKTGRRPGWKKAYVSLQAGQEIDFMSAE